MGRTLDQVIAELPAGRRRRIEARYQALRQEVEGLGELRKLAGKAQADVASALSIKQPSVSKLEKQADMYLSTLRKYVEAIGGELELVVRLPAGRTISLQNLGDLSGAEDPLRRITGGRKRVGRAVRRERRKAA